ncbi:MAG: hypothetical protein DAHOPDDO_00832 [Ignavibacteriaceae bacterium]|nr:hypothetical protein [Ignavibacteriaceae bacterium]
MELNFNETFIIEVFRKFDFLRKLEYNTSFVSIYGRDPCILFENKSLKRKIHISWEGDLILLIERTKKINIKNQDSIIVMSNYYKYYNINFSSLSLKEKIYQNAELLKSKFLLVLEGKAWIEDLIK